MDDWTWDSPEWTQNAQPAAPEAPQRRLNFFNLLTDQLLMFVILLIAFLGFKFFGGDTYKALRSDLQERLNEKTSLDTVLGKEDKPESAAPTSSEVAPASVAPVAVSAPDPYAEYDEESAQACVFDLSEIRLLSSNKQAVNSMCMPINSTNVTSVFGYRVNPITGNYAMHSGLDLGADMGEPIYAALSGEVVKAKYNYDYGNFITLDHGDGLVTLYAHCSQLLVEAGDRVEKGQVIARAGSTGWSTGPHLHFEVRVQGVRIDPSTYLTRLYSA